MIGPDGMCRCDVYLTEHVPGLVQDDRWCETLYVAPTISPHLFGVRPDGSRPDTWPELSRTTETVVP